MLFLQALLPNKGKVTIQRFKINCNKRIEKVIKKVGNNSKIKLVKLLLGLKF